MGNNSFLGNKKGRPDFLQIALEKFFVVGNKKTGAAFFAAPASFGQK